MLLVMKMEHSCVYLEHKLLYIFIYLSSLCLKQELYTFSIQLTFLKMVEQIRFLSLYIFCIHHGHIIIYVVQLLCNFSPIRDNQEYTVDMFCRRGKKI
jgi:hypothetical protein